MPGNRLFSISSSPLRTASVRPFSVSPTSTQPVKRFSEFHSLSPWRSSTSVAVSPMRVSLSRTHSAIGSVIVVVDQVGEGLQILQRLTARHPPLPLFLDRRTKTQLQQRIEVRIHRFEHLP